MNFDKARQQFSDITSRFGFKKVLGCGCLGCLVPMLALAIFFVAVGWWLMADTSAAQPAYPMQRYVSVAPVAMPSGQQGQQLRPGVPTPVYTPDNAQGGIRTGEPSMMGNQPLSPEYGYMVEGQAAYMPYAGDYSPAANQWYLARANFTGARRTPYVRGQVLSNGMTVVTADFDSVLLQDANGTQWACDPTGMNCQFWR